MHVLHLFVQAVPSFPSSFPHLFSGKENLRCLIPCAIDQVRWYWFYVLVDFIWRLTRMAVAISDYCVPVNLFLCCWEITLCPNSVHACRYLKKEKRHKRICSNLKAFGISQMHVNVMFYYFLWALHSYYWCYMWSRMHCILK